MQGGLLEAGSRGIIGWAQDQQRPSEVVRVVLSVGDKPVVTVVANQFDLDVVRRQIGPGVGGFAVQLPSLPADGPPFIVTARSSSGRKLGEPLSIPSVEQMAACVAGGAVRTFDGMVDLLASGRLQGWLWYPDEAEQIAEVEVFDGDALLGRAKADHFRADLKQASKRGGHCGFVLELPATLLDMKPHTIRVLAAGTKVELRNSPLQFGPLVVSGLTTEVSLLRRDVDQLMSRLDFLASAEGKLQSEILQILAERISAFSAIHADALDRRLELGLKRLAEPRRLLARD